MDNQIMQLSEIQMNYGLMSDDDDDEISCYTSDDILHSARQDVISNSLAETGTINGMAAAAALSTVRRKSKCFKFEMDPAVRKRIQTRLTKKLKHIIDELCSRCGQQAVVVSVSPGKENSSFRVFGSQPLDQAVRVCQTSILGEFEKDLQAKVDAKNISNNEPLFQLPSLAVGGIPTSVDRMNQAQLRMFIPEMLKYATGRGKPGWGKETMKPIWWPIDVPWANVRCDVRDDEIKHKVPWSQALRQIVKNCYQFHNREDLLNGISYDRSNQATNCTHVATASTTCHKLKLPPNQQAVITPPTFVHTIHNADGSVALVHYDSGQTLATISADNADNALAALHTTSDNEIRLDEMNTTWELTANSDSIANTTTYNVIESEVGQHQLLAEEGMGLSTNEETSDSPPDGALMAFYEKMKTYHKNCNSDQQHKSENAATSSGQLNRHLSHHYPTIGRGHMSSNGSEIFHSNDVNEDTQISCEVTIDQLDEDDLEEEIEV